MLDVSMQTRFILWYKGDRLVEYDTSGGRISVSTEPTGVSHLLLRHARPGDSANYTCSPSAGAPASLTLNTKDKPPCNKGTPPLLRQPPTTTSSPQHWQCYGVLVEEWCKDWGVWGC
ncbi:hypothetical protein O3P69_014790 [Scylla paramamosain]|uniref:Ig-like domain-containing protein n=1 Tax=Scylla paramamosain TaxID=85552 RepID=A0AAW0U120_SCYPA